MERFLRRFLDGLGASVESLAGKEGGRLRAEDLIADMYHALESNLTEDQQGVRRVVPARIAIAMSYELHSELKQEAVEEIQRELTAAVSSYIRDHRYILHSPLVVEITCDPFLRKPLEFRVNQPAATVASVGYRLVSERGGEFRLGFGDAREPGRFTIGRSPDNDIKLDDPTISRFHASITVNQRGEIIVSDLGSANGTFVNGQRIVASVIVRPHDVLKIGSLRFELRKG